MLLFFYRLIIFRIVKYFACSRLDMLLRDTYDWDRLSAHIVLDSTLSLSCAIQLILVYTPQLRFGRAVHLTA